jgi:hypothetical protein
MLWSREIILGASRRRCYRHNCGAALQGWSLESGFQLAGRKAYHGGNQYEKAAYQEFVGFLAGTAVSGEGSCCSMVGEPPGAGKMHRMILRPVRSELQK